MAFVLGTSPGPRRMKVQWHGQQMFELDGIEELFPVAADIDSTDLRVGRKTFRMYYDKEKYPLKWEEGVYVFMALAGSGRAINICHGHKAQPKGASSLRHGRSDG